MGKRRRKISCGRYAAEYCFSRGSRYDCPKARAEKRHHTSQVQQALNDKNALIYNAAVIAGTFLDDPTSMFVTLTLDDDHYPYSDRPWESLGKILRLLDNYIARLQRLAKRRGAELAYGWSPGQGDFGRYHIHMLIRGLSREDVCTVWGLGDVNAHYLYGDTTFLADRDWTCGKKKEVNPERIAHYMVNNAKPLRKVGGRLIHFSRSCVRPTVAESTPVPDGFRLEPPEGSTTVDQHAENTLYSSLAFVSYLLPGAKTRRRKRKLRGAAP
ncbi:MAG: hypothetical protein Q4P84_05815 [Elusimicrobiales bacterium]|nr:hypothetical protein [Elusimicrobiales bacterium]